MISITQEQDTQDTQKTVTSVPKMPIQEKLCLSIREAAAYTGIGLNRLERMANEPNCPFVVYVGRKKLIRRKDLEKYINTSHKI